MTAENDRIEALATPPRDALTAEIERLALGDPLGPPNSAPIVWPTPESLSVKLVDARGLDHLNEARSDSDLMKVLCVAAAGLSGGLLPSAIHTSPLSLEPIWTTLDLGLCGLTLVTGLLWRRAARRVAQLRIARDRRDAP